MAHRSREKPSHHTLNKGREKVERKKKGIHNEKDGKERENSWSNHSFILKSPEEERR